MDKKYKRAISEEDSIAVRFRTYMGKVIHYVVRLECVIRGKRYGVMRFDNAHGRPHRHTLGTTGRTIDKVWYDKLSYSEGLTEAIEDIENNYEFYRERFIKWLSEK